MREQRTEPVERVSDDRAPAPRGRRFPAMGQLPFLLVLGITAVGLILVAVYAWRRGTTVIGGALLVAALFRAVLPSDQAGLLGIRGRAVDVLTYSALGAAMIFVAATIAKELS